jgi:hypothetical protein
MKGGIYQRKRIPTQETGAKTREEGSASESPQVWIGEVMVHKWSVEELKQMNENLRKQETDDKKADRAAMRASGKSLRQIAADEQKSPRRVGRPPKIVRENIIPLDENGRMTAEPEDEPQPDEPALPEVIERAIARSERLWGEIRIVKRILTPAEDALLLTYRDLAEEVHTNLAQIDAGCAVVISFDNEQNANDAARVLDQYFFQLYDMDDAIQTWVSAGIRGWRLFVKRGLSFSQ